MKFKSDIEVQAGLEDSSGSLGTSGQILSSTGSNVSWINQSTIASDVQNQVKAGVAITKGQAVYVTGADGTNIIVGLASNTTEATSSKTLGLLNATVAINGFADVVQIGRLSGLNTSGATAGDPVWLGTNGNLIYGLANKPYAPAHLVFIGIVTRVNSNNGEIFINVQNGFELKEIHDVDIITNVPINGDVLGYDGTLWVNKTIAEWLGYTPAPASGSGNYIQNQISSAQSANMWISGNAIVNGSISIGTTSQAMPLQVRKDQTSDTAIVVSNAGTVGSTTTMSFVLQESGTPQGWFRRYRDGSGLNEIGFSTVLAFSGSVTGTKSERMRITSTGDIAIGASSAFTIGGTAKLSVYASGPSTFGLSSTDAVYLRRYGAGQYQFQTTATGGNNGDLSLQSYGGNVGIGTTSPNTKLSVATVWSNGTDTPFISSQVDSETLNRIGTHVESTSTAATAMTFYTHPANNASSEKMRITSAGNVGIGTTSPAYKTDISGNLRFSTGYLNSDDCFERVFPAAISFPNGTANLAADIILGNLSFWGYIEVEITGSFNNQSSGGKLTKVFAVGTNPNNLIYVNESRVSDVLGTIKDNIAIGDFSWDATNSRYRIPISHIVSTSNTYTIKVRMFSQGLGSKPVFDAISVGGTYTLTALSRQYPYFNERLGVGTTNPGSTLEIRASDPNLTINQTTTTSNSGIKFQSNGNPIGNITAQGNNGNMNINMGPSAAWGGFITFQTDTSERMRINASGNVGIGTTSPSARLNVLNASSTTGALIGGGTATPAWVQIGTVDSGVTPFIQGINNGLTSNVNLSLNPSGGNVGVGTTSPGARLDVIGSFDALPARILRQATYGEILRIGRNGVSETASINYPADGVFAINTAGSERMRINAAGNVGIGTTSPSQKLEVRGFSSIPDSGQLIISEIDNPNRRLSLGVNNSANLGYIQSLVLGDNYYSLALNPQGGNVGIGTNNPSAKLDVNGNGFFGVAAQVKIIGADNGGIDYFAADGTTFNIRTTAYNNPIVFSQASGERMRINSLGNVGIGTTSPDVFSRGYSGKILGISSSGQSSIELNSASGNGAYFDMGVSGSRTFNIYSDISSTEISTVGSLPLSLATNSTSRIYILSGGNVGIGTTSPGSKLQVDGAGYSFITGYDSGNRRVYIGLDSAGEPSIQGALSNGTARQLSLNPNGGNVGIGTTSPTALLDIQPASGTSVLRVARTGGTDVRVAASITSTGGIIGTYTNSPFDIYTNSTSKVRVTETGNVGIGTTSPAAKLDVIQTTSGLSGWFMAGQFSAANYPMIRLAATTPDKYLSFGNDGDGSFNVFTNGSSSILGNLSLKITSTGNVGIGTALPNNKLSIVGGSVDLQDGSGKIGFNVNDSFTAYGGSIAHYGMSRAGGAEPVALSGYYGLGFFTNGSEKMRVTQAGNIGIGTTSPAYKLDIVGDIKSTTAYVNDGTTIVRTIPTSGIGYFGTQTNHPLAIQTNSDEKVRITTTGNVGIGTTSPSQKLDVVGAIRVRNNLGVYFDTTGESSSNYVGTVNDYWLTLQCNRGNTSKIDLTNGTGILFSESGSERMRINASGNVGIGTSAPTNRLHVLGGILNGAVATFSGQNNDRGLVVSTFNSGNSDAGVLLNAQTALGVLAFATVGSERMRITSTGNVGIGTTSPDYPLTVNSINVGAPGANLGIILSNIIDTAIPSSSVKAIIGVTNSGFGYSAGSLLIQPRTGVSAVTAFATEGTEKMRIASTGNVGIGTTSPSAKLDVAGTVLTTSTLGSTAGSYAIDHPGINTWKIGVTATNSSTFHIGNDTGGSFVNKILNITAGGNVGIGTTSPNGQLDVYSSVYQRLAIKYPSTYVTKLEVGGGSYIQQDAGNEELRLAQEYGTGKITFFTGATNTERMRITSAGNVGIGTTSPSAKLDVEGDALINGLTIGRGPGNVATNTALGAGALGGNSSGTNNIAIGKSANWFSDLSGTTVIGNEMASSTSGGLLPSNCLAISQFNPEFTGAQYPHFYAPEKISVNNGTTADVIAFSVDAYSGAFIEYVIRTTDGGEFAAGTVTVAWKGSGSGNLKDNRDVVWSSFMDDFEFILTGNTVQLRNQSTDDAWIRITVRAIMSDNLL